MNKTFLDPKTPLVDAVAAWLGQRKRDTPAGVPALDHLFVVVPTREAGRRLRVALARRFESCGGVVPPRIGTPGRLLVPADPGPRPTASAAECRAALAKVLLELAPCECAALVPAAARPDADGADPFAWALREAAALGRVQDRLAQAALLCADVPARLADYGLDTPPEELARWRDLALLEGRLFARLEALGLEHPSQTRVRAAAAPARPEGVEAVVLPALADAAPAFFAALARLEGDGLAVECLLHAAPADAAGFDERGLPREDAPWTDPARAPLPLADSDIVRRPDGRAQAEAVARAWAAARGPADRAPAVALGMVDADLRPALESAFLALPEPVALHDPADRPLRETSLGRVVDLAARLLGPDPDFAALSAFLRETDAREALYRDGRSHARALETLDRLQREHLPRTLGDVRHFLREELADAAAEEAANPDGRVARRAKDHRDLAGLLDDLDALLARPEGAAPGGPEHLLAALGRLFARRAIREGDESDANLEAAAEAVRSAAREASSPAVAAVLSAEERAALLRSMLAEASYPLEGDPDAVPALGWLELPWCDEPRLVLAGFNEGSVPESVLGDAFLPDAALRALGLPDNGRRFARDAFLLSEILACRGRGAVRVFFEKLAADGSARKPSRLLFLCPDEALGARAKRLFADLDRVPDVPGAVPPDVWRLDLPAPPDAPPDRLRVTDFSVYLANPLQWFLGRELGDDDLGGDPAAEIPDNDFGTICHAALEAFAAPDAPRESEDPDEILDFLDGRIRAIVRARYAGRAGSLTAAVRLQEASMLARMRTFSRLQAGLARDGWRIRRAETALEGFVEGVRVTGKADRIDENVLTGAWRVLDYKTWSKLDRAGKFRSPGPPPAFADAADAARDGVLAAPLDGADLAGRTPKAAFWTDLQLPLYAIFARGNPELGISAGAAVSCGYVVLGDDADDSGIAGLAAPTPEGLDMAWRTAGAVVRRISAGLLLPPGGLAGARLAPAYRALLPDGPDPELGLAGPWLADQAARREDYGAAHPVPPDFAATGREGL